MNTLILPKHVAERRIKEVEKEKKARKKIKKQVGGFIPRAGGNLGGVQAPLGGATLPIGGRMAKKGGIILSDKTVSESQIATNCGLVMETGPDAYNDKDKFPNGPWCKKKDWVLFARYAGSRIYIDGGEIRVLNDDEILGTIEDPEDILHALTV